MLVGFGPYPRADLSEFGDRQGAALVSDLAAGCAQGREHGIARCSPDFLCLQCLVHQDQQHGVPVLTGLDGPEALAVGRFGIGDCAGLDLIPEGGIVGRVVARNPGSDQRQAEQARSFVFADLFQ